MSIIGVVADNLESYPADLLKTLLFLQKTSSCTDCILVSNEGTPVHAHLVILSLSWPALDKLLPPSAAHCDCLCCVLRITVAAETKTIELLVELAYTGMTGLVGLNEEVKVKHLLQALGLEWVLEREEIMPEECNNNEMTDKSNNLECEKKSNMPIKDLLGKGLLLSSADAEDAVGALFDYSSESYEMYGESYRRKSIPRGAKSKMLDDKSISPVLRINKKVRGSAQSKPLDPVKDSSKEQGNVPGLPEEVLAVIPVTVETKELDSSNVEKTSPLIKVLPTVVASIVDAPQNMKMIAPGTLMTTAGSSVRFFCSHCEEEITKYSKAEKEAHWAVAHFSDQLSQFITGQACNICNFQVDSVIELIKHVAITHKKIYSCLSGLPPSSGAIAKETVAQSIPHLFTSRTVTVNPNNKLDNPFVFIKCVLQNLPSSVHHLTTAFLEERSSNIQSVSPLFPTTSRHWYYTGSSSNNNPDSPVLSSLACHYSSLLGKEDSDKCSYCPHKKYQHARTSLHQENADPYVDRRCRLL